MWIILDKPCRTTRVLWEQSISHRTTDIHLSNSTQSPLVSSPTLQNHICSEDIVNLLISRLAFTCSLSCPCGPFLKRSIYTIQCILFYGKLVFMNILLF